MAESHREEIAKLEALYAGNPGGRVFVHLAEAYRKAGEHERARRILDEGLARHTDSASGYVVLGRVLADMQITSEAEVAFRRVLDLDSGNLVALRWLGDLARQSGRMDEAVAHYRDLLARNPSNEEVRDLVEIVEREAATGGAHPVAEEPVWQEPEPAEQVTEPPAAPLTPLSAAPGRTGDEEPADVEYGLVEIDAIHAEPEATERPEPVEPAPPSELAPEVEAEGLVIEAAPLPAEDAAVVETYEGAEDGIEELAGLARSDEADELDIHLLDPAYSSDEQPAGSYADDEFIADLMSAGEEPEAADALEADTLDVLGSSSPLTLQGGERESEAAAAEQPPAADAVAGPTGPGEAETASSREPAMEPWDASGEAEDAVAFDGYGGTSAGEPSALEPAAEAELPLELPSVAEPADEISAAGATGAPQAVSPGAEESAPPLLTPHGDDLAEAALGTGAEPAPVTETMAELYRAQGFHERAAEVYRALLRHRPFDLRLSEKLSEAEADAAAARAEQAAAAAIPEPEDEVAGEVWLRGVGAPWDAGDVDAGHGASPYGWTDEVEDQPAGEPIATYLRDLVSWKTASQRWAEVPPPAPPPAAPAQQQAPWSPDDEPWASAPVDDAWGTAEPAETVDPWGAEAGKASSPWGEPAAAACPESVAGEPSEPWNAAPADDDPAGGSAEPAAPWPQGMAAMPADPWAGAVEPAAEPAAEASEGWSPLDATAAGESADQAEDSDAEDEDLEMFRSWLQSLKK